PARRKGAKPEAPKRQSPDVFALLRSRLNLCEHCPMRLQTQPHQSRQRLKSVGHTDLLALADRAWRIGDRNVGDPFAESQHLGCDLGLDVEAIAFQLQSTPEVRVQDLVAGLHVANSTLEKDIGRQIQLKVADGKPQ